MENMLTAIVELSKIMKDSFPFTSDKKFLKELITEISKEMLAKDSNLKKIEELEDRVNKLSLAVNLSAQQLG